MPALKDTLRRLTTALVYTSLFTLPCTHASAAGNAKAGQEKSAVCQGCHGADGNSVSPDFPHLAGQLSSYLTKEITDFKDGKRTNETMNAMVAGLDKKDIPDIVAYFSSQHIKPETGKKVDANVIESGKKIYRGGNTFSGVPACASCHGPNGVGNGPGKFPLLAGQRPEYIIKALNDFRSGQRHNDVNEIMRTIARKLTDNEIKTVAAYIAYIPIDRQTHLSSAKP